MTQTGLSYQQCIEKAATAGQGHVFRWWDELPDAARQKLAGQICKVDFGLIQSLSDRFLGRIPPRFGGTLEPAEFVRLPKNPQEQESLRRARQTGGDAISRGKVALFIVAGGQGSRLKYDPPKGTFPICPITGKSLFEVFAERVRATEKRYTTELPLYIMTSTINDGATRRFFEENDYFQLDRSRVSFFPQDMLPTLDTDGRFLLKRKYEIAVNPNGHGGSIKALHDSGALDDMARRGIKYVSYHQVDNVLVHSIDPAFIGYHIAGGAEMSLKVLEKRDAEEKLGVVGRVAGRMRVVEYSDLDKKLMHARNPDGSLVYRIGSIAIHLFNIDFIERLNDGGFHLPYHVAEKVCSYVDENGVIVKPERENCIKFETFVFDALPEARAAVVVETDRDEEFAPMKNEKGDDSPQTSVNALVNRNGRWLRQAGVEIPTDAEGNVRGMIEISPLFALDAEELAGKISADLKFDGKLLL